VVIRQDTLMFQSVNVTVNLSFKVGHTPTPVDQKEANGQDDFNACTRQIAPVADI